MQINQLKISLCFFENLFIRDFLNNDELFKRYDFLYNEEYQNIRYIIRSQNLTYNNDYLSYSAYLLSLEKEDLNALNVRKYDPVNENEYSYKLKLSEQWGPIYLYIKTRYSNVIFIKEYSNLLDKMQIKGYKKIQYLWQN